jgi:hypothetical protein
MDTSAPRNGWKRLSNGFDVEFRHSVPYRLSDNGRSEPDDSMLVEEITALGRLHVQLGQWEAGERPGEREARLYVSRGEFAEVLRRLAQSSAALFIDRYRKPIDTSDIDWDRLEYLKDFQAALDHCRLGPGDMDQDAYRDIYIEVMHRETRGLAESGESPPVEPE